MAGLLRGVPAHVEFTARDMFRSVASEFGRGYMTPGSFRAAHREILRHVVDAGAWPEGVVLAMSDGTVVSVSAFRAGARIVTRYADRTVPRTNVLDRASVRLAVAYVRAAWGNRPMAGVTVG